MCDSVVASGPHTSSGVTLFGKNSDRKQGECQPFVQFPDAVYARGAELRCSYLTIPQVGETYRVMGHSPWWVWGFEHGVNEQGVAIGNHTVFSQEPVEEAHGLIGMDLVRLGLERGRDAREALEVIAALLEAHGQGGSALEAGAAGYHNSFLVADPGEAWLLETSGRRWAAKRVSLESVSNHMSLKADWQIGSRDLESFARAEGWWRGTGRVDFSAAYRNPHVPRFISEGRKRRAARLLAEGDGVHDAASLQRLLRDHGEDSSPGDGPPVDFATDDERYYSLCMHSEPVGTTTASMVSALPADREAPWPVWISFGNPCISVFIPVYIDGVIPAALARGGDQFEEGSAWWVFHRLQEAAESDLQQTVSILREGWASLEEKIERERASVESRAHGLAVAGDRDAADALLSEFMARTVAQVIEHAEELRARITL